MAEYEPSLFQKKVIDVVEDQASKRGINFSELGRRASLTKSSIESLKQIRKGKQRLNMKHFIQIANVLEVEPSYLLYLAERTYSTEDDELALAAEKKADYNAQKKQPEKLKKAANHD